MALSEKSLENFRKLGGQATGARWWSISDSSGGAGFQLGERKSRNPVMQGAKILSREGPSEKGGPEGKRADNDLSIEELIHHSRRRP